MIRTVNDVLPGVKRPFRLQDIEFVWEGLNSALAASVGSTPRILSGFNIKADNNLSAGVIAFNGQLYMHPDTDGYRIPLDATVYAGSAPSADDMRAFADGTVQNMYWYDVLSTNKTIAEGVEGVLVGAFTKANIEAWSAFGGGGGNTKIFNMTGIYAYLASANPTTITLSAETLNELSDAVSMGKQIVLTDMATYVNEIYFINLSLYRRDGQTYYFTINGYVATGSSTAITTNGMGFVRSRGITINMTTGVVNTVTNNMVQLNVHSADGATQNIVSSYPNAVFNFPQNVLIKDVGSVVTGNWGSGKRYDAGINANTDVELNFFNPLYVASVKVATVDGISEIAVRHPTQNNRRGILVNNGVTVVSADTASNGGLTFVNSDRTAVIGSIGARVTGNTLDNLFIGWGSDFANPLYNLSVGSDKFTYKNVDVALTEDNKTIIIHKPSPISKEMAKYESTGVAIIPTPSNNSTGITWMKQNTTDTLVQIGAFTNGDSEENIFTFMGWKEGTSYPYSTANNLAVGKNRLTYKNKNVWYDGLTGIVNTAALADKAVTYEKMAADAIGYSNIKDGVVGAAKLIDEAVTNAKLADNSVGTSKIQNGAVTNLKLANNAVDTLQIANNAVQTTKIKDGAVTPAKMSFLAPKIILICTFTNGSLSVDYNAYGWNVTRSTPGINWDFIGIQYPNNEEIIQDINAFYLNAPSEAIEPMSCSMWTDGNSKKIQLNVSSLKFNTVTVRLIVYQRPD